MSKTAREEYYMKRRNSYSEAIGNENSPDDHESHPRRRSLATTTWNTYRTPKLSDNTSLGSGTWSSGSSISKRDLTRESSADTTKSWGEKTPEIFNTHRNFEVVSTNVKSPLLNSKSNNSIECQCRCRCQCRCSQCLYQRRKISSSSMRDSYLGYHKRKDSSYSVSTCQSTLPLSSGRNSSASLYHGNESNEVGMDHVERRHSDETHSTFNGGKIGRVDNRRRFSEQTHQRDQIDKRTGNEANTAKPIIARTCPGSVLKEEEKVTEKTQRETLKSLTLKGTDGRKRRDSETMGTTDNRRKSSIAITPNMLKRRFSEQLILEGGLGSIHGLEDLLEAEDEDVEEESLTAINARKKITIKSHYYPEGGWGCVIVLTAVLVQLISHSLQLGYGVILTPLMSTFDHSHADAGTVNVVSRSQDPANVISD